MYVYFPIPLAAAIGLSAGETVYRARVKFELFALGGNPKISLAHGIEWELLDRGELHLVRQRVPLPTSVSKGKRR